MPGAARAANGSDPEPLKRARVGLRIASSAVGDQLSVREGPCVRVIEDLRGELESIARIVRWDTR